jgi:hypothetical protein
VRRSSAYSRGPAATIADRAADLAIAPRFGRCGPGGHDLAEHARPGVHGGFTAVSPLQSALGEDDDLSMGAARPPDWVPAGQAR